MNMVSVLTANGRSFVENAGEAGFVTLLGMVAIFAVLAILWGVVEILHAIMSREPKPKKAEPIAEPTPVKEEPASEEPAEDNGALIAAITAAITASRADAGYTGGFRVVSFRRATK